MMLKLNPTVGRRVAAMKLAVLVQAALLLLWGAELARPARRAEAHHVRHGTGAAGVYH